MGKNAVYTFSETDIISSGRLKKNSLLFDKIFINEVVANRFLNPKTKVSNSADLIEQSNLEIEYLKKNNVIEFYKTSTNKEVAKYKDLDLLEDRVELLKEIGEVVDTMKNLVKVDPKIIVTLLPEVDDLFVRMDAAVLSKSIQDEFYPILKTKNSYKHNGKKHQTVSFLLNNIPEPEEHTPWEHILEYRSDVDMRNKYLALINWVNKVSASNSSFSDIKEEYEYLYNSYIKHFKLHRMKFNNTMLELLVTAGAGILLALQSPQFIMPFKNLLQINLSYVNLLQEEEKLPGRELAYIYEINNTFSITTGGQ